MTFDVGSGMADEGLSRRSAGSSLGKGTVNVMLKGTGVSFIRSGV